MGNTRICRPRTGDLYSSLVLLILLFAATQSRAEEVVGSDTYAAAPELLRDGSAIFDSATSEPGEPAFATNLLYGQTLWWKWTAPADGVVTLQCGSTLYSDLQPILPVIAVFTGDTLDTAIPVSHRQVTPRQDFPTLVIGGPILQMFNAQAGITYRIGVDAENVQFIIQNGVYERVFTNRLKGGVTLSLQFAPAPTNDRFADAITLPGELTELSGELQGARGEDGELVAPGGSGRTVWFNWTAPKTGMYRFRPASTSQTAIVNFWRGSELATLALFRSSGTFWSSRCGAQWRSKEVLAVSARAGEAFRIQVDTVDLLFTGSYFFAVEFDAPPSNDDFANRIELTGNSVSIMASNLGATTEPSENSDGAASLWYSWTAPADGSITVSTNEPVIHQPPGATNLPTLFNGSTGVIGVVVTQPVPCHWSEEDPDLFEPSFAIYSGTNLTALTLLADGKHAVAKVRAGERYLIAMTSKRGIPGETRLALALNALPPNDNFSDAIPVGTGHVRFTGYLTAATPEPNEPQHGGLPARNSVWWTWTAPGTGETWLNSSAFPVGTRVGIYTGATFEALGPVTVATNSSGVLTFQAVRGTAYRIAIDAIDIPGDVTVEIEMMPSFLSLTRPIEDITGSFWFYLLDRAGARVRIDFSKDLLGWIPISTNLLDSDVTRITIPKAAGESSGFCRIVPMAAGD